MSANGVHAGPTVLGTLSGAPCAPAPPQQPFPPPLTHAPCVQLILSSSPSLQAPACSRPRSTAGTAPSWAPWTPTPIRLVASPPCCAPVRPARHGLCSPCTLASPPPSRHRDWLQASRQTPTRAPRSAPARSLCPRLSGLGRVAPGLPGSLPRRLLRRAAAPLAMCSAHPWHRPRPAAATCCRGALPGIRPCRRLTALHRVQHDAVPAAAIPVRALAALPPLAPPPLRRHLPAAPSCFGLRPASTSRGPHGLYGVACPVAPPRPLAVHHLPYAATAAPAIAPRGASSATVRRQLVSPIASASALPRRAAV